LNPIPDITKVYFYPILDDSALLRVNFLGKFELIYVRMKTLLGEFVFFNRVNGKCQLNFMEAGQYNGKNET
jgi:hypothetical protein